MRLKKDRFYLAECAEKFFLEGSEVNETYAALLELTIFEEENSRDISYSELGCNFVVLIDIQFTDKSLVAIFFSEFFYRGS